MMLFNILLALLGAELAFLVALLVGLLLAILAGMLATTLRGVGYLSMTRAIGQGVIAGVLAGTSAYWAASWIAGARALPHGWVFWLAIALPFYGEFGDFLNRFSLRYRGKPDSGIFVPLGRLHMVVKEPFRTNVFHLATYIFANQEPDEVGKLAYRKMMWFVGWMSFFLLVSAIGSVAYFSCIEK
jgi:hypothetical protein